MNTVTSSPFGVFGQSFARAGIAAALVVVGLGAGAGAGSAQAQDASLRPNVGTVTLNAGFEPDPRVVRVRAGGTIDASTLGGRCVGNISNAPDYRINYTPGGVPLTIRVRSQHDTTLVINGPNGVWTCSDDIGTSPNPGVTYRTPAAGAYDVWIGSYTEDAVDAELRITELD